MSNSDGTSSWAFGQTSSPLSSTTIFGPRSLTGLGSSTAALGFYPVRPLGSSSSTSGGSSVFARKSPLGAVSTTGLDFNSFHAFCENSMVCGGSSSLSGFETHSSLVGSQATTPIYSFEQSEFGGQERGSKVAVYQKTAEPAFGAEKLVSISAMPAYKTKSHEELKWEDNQFNGKGGFGLNSSTVQSTSSGLSPFSSSHITHFPTPSWRTPPISTTPVKPNSLGNPFISLVTQTKPWKFPGPKPTAFTPQPLHFSSSANNSSTIPVAPSATATLSAPVFGPSTYSDPRSVGSSAIASHTSVSTVTPNSLNPFKPFGPQTTLTSPTSTASTPCTSISLSLVNHNPFTNPFTPVTTQTSSFKFPGPTPATSTSHLPCTSPSANTFWTTPICTSSISTMTAAADPVSVLPVSCGLGFTFNQPTTLFKPHIPSSQNCNGAVTEIFSQNSFAQQSTPQITSSEQPSSVASPYGTLPPKPRMFFEGSGPTQSIQYGISSMPIPNKPAPLRCPTLLTIRHLSRRSKLPVRKYDPKLNGPKVPYYSDKEMEVHVFLPRKNPRTLVVCPEQWPTRTITEKMYAETLTSSIIENESGDIKGYTSSDFLTKERELSETAPDIVQLLSKLHPSEDYYTEPQVSELEAKERAEPGFCSHVKDFVVGRNGYGSIKFLGETDVRNVDLKSCVEFNKREVIVYMDESKKPPVGKGLNKPAELTLLDIKCIDKKTGKQYTDGPKVDKYKEMLKEMLKKKAAEQGAEFVSYDPVGGEWKFRVQHF